MTTAPTAPAQPRESIAAKQAAFSDSLCEPEYAAVRRLLGLRPDSYNDEGVDNHPDRRPCPPWCWVGQSHGEYGHSIDRAHPMDAEQHHDGIPHVVASLYQGHLVSGGEHRYIQAATIEPHLEQLGQAAPVIRVALRHWEGQEARYGDIL